MLIAPIAVVVVMASLRRWTSSYGFVYLRTVDQIVAGNGPVYNEGQRVETFMSPLWLAPVTIGEILSPLRLEVVAAGLSIACIGVAMLLSTFGSVRITRLDDLTGVLVPLGTAVFAVLWPVWIWTTGGDRNRRCLFVDCPLLLHDDSLGRRSGIGPLPVPIATLIVVGMGWVVRPELASSSVLFVAVLVLTSTDSKRQRWVMVAIAAVVPVVYQVFRMGFYGLVVPNPAISRDALTSHPSDGWNYLVNFVAPYGLVVPVLAIAIGVGGPLVQRLLRRWSDRCRPGRGLGIWRAAWCMPPRSSWWAEITCTPASCCQRCSPSWLRSAS